MATLPEVSPYPGCPHCTGRGLARAVAVKSGERTLTYECESCRYRWDVTAPMPTDRWASPFAGSMPESERR